MKKIPGKYFHLVMSAVMPLMMGALMSGNFLPKPTTATELSIAIQHALRDKTAREIIQYLKVPVLKIPAILTRGKKEFHKGIADVKPIAGLQQ